MKVMVTGATGFVGRGLCPLLVEHAHEVVAISRGDLATNTSWQSSVNPRHVAVGEIGPETDWRHLLEGVQAVVHLAARVHVMRDDAADPLQLYRVVNRDSTANLAYQAALSGVRRFVFVSTIKVNGEGGERPYDETDSPAPEDAYAISKWEAEQQLAQIAKETSLEVVILRPPLVYGHGVGANFLRLIHAVERGWPLPLGRVANRRSLLFLGNLVDAIRLCLEHPAAAGKTYMVSDGEDVSSPELARRLASAMGRSERLLPLPISWFRFAGRMTGRRAEVDRLLGSLAIDSSLIRRELSWRPPYSLNEGLAVTVRNIISG